MKEEQIKKAFGKVKQDIHFLRNEIFHINETLEFIKNKLNSLNFQENNPSFNEKPLYMSKKLTSTDSTHNSTNPANSTDTSTVPYEIEGLKCQNLGISTGNEGVSTDRQTDTSTDTSTHITNNSSIESDIREASEILESLDNLKREIRIKFKKVTPQEMLVFSKIYQLEEQNPLYSNYQAIAKDLNLSQSSVRDYVQRMINKGIPLKKQKLNNKKVLLSISSDLKKIATLKTIMQLREL